MITVCAFFLSGCQTHIWHCAHCRALQWVHFIFYITLNWIESYVYRYAVHRVFIRHHELTNESNLKHELNAYSSRLDRPNRFTINNTDGFSLKFTFQISIWDSHRIHGGRTVCHFFDSKIIVRQNCLDRLLVLVHILHVTAIQYESFCHCIFCFGPHFSKNARTHTHTSAIVCDFKWKSQFCAYIRIYRIQYIVNCVCIDCWAIAFQ